METPEEWEEVIWDCLDAAGRRSRALTLNVKVLAVALWRLSVSVRETSRLDAVSLTGPNGAMQQHPAFKLQTDTEASILRQLKEMGLTAEGTAERLEENDRLLDLLRTVGGAPATKKKVKPDAMA